MGGRGVPLVCTSFLSGRKGWVGVGPPKIKKQVLPASMNVLSGRKGPLRSKLHLSFFVSSIDEMRVT